MFRVGVRKGAVRVTVLPDSPFQGAQECGLGFFVRNAAILEAGNLHASPPECAGCMAG